MTSYHGIYMGGGGTYIQGGLCPVVCQQPSLKDGCVRSVFAEVATGEAEGYSLRALPGKN